MFSNNYLEWFILFNLCYVHLDVTALQILLSQPMKAGDIPLMFSIISSLFSIFYVF